MKKTTYYCNLCGEEHVRDFLIAMVWDAERKSWDFFPFPHNHFDRSDRHICKDCVGWVKSIASVEAKVR